MKLANFTLKNQNHLGILLKNGEIICLENLNRINVNAGPIAIFTVHYDPMISLISQLPQLQDSINGLLENIPQSRTKEYDNWRSNSVLLRQSEVRFLSPILKPSKIIAIGLNYMDHCRETGTRPPEDPIVFTKFPNAIIGTGEHIRWKNGVTSKVDYEAELGVIIGKRGREISAEKAFDHIVGYTALNDVSARDIQLGDGQWVRGKSLDTFCPIGPVIVTKDEIPDPHNLKIQCIVNEQKMQDSSTSEMIFKIPRLVEFISRTITLEAGDIIATGTPHGVGMGRKPEKYLQHGDTVKVVIEKIGILENKIEVYE